MSTLRLATSDEVAKWDDMVIKNPSGGDVFQTKAFADVKTKYGWTPQYTVYNLGDRLIATLYLTRKIPILGELWYSPKGPGVTTKTDLQKILEANVNFAKTRRIFAFKLDPEVLKTAGHPPGLIKVHNVQPNANTVIVDLAPTEDNILASFRQRARRAIRQAQAAGICVKPGGDTPQDFKQMYNLYNSTGSRAGFHVRDFTYYQSLWQAWIDANQGRLFFAFKNKQLIAGAFVSYLGKKGLYKDGASDRSALGNGAAYLLQWEIMRWLKSKGILSYDLHGTPPAEELENRQHKFYGLGLFKTSFADLITEYIGTVDQVINPLAYKAWRKLGDRWAQSFEYRFRGRTFY